MNLLLPLRLARRELRGGLAGFRIFLACLTLGVAAIATVQSVSSGIYQSLRDDGRSILGGDVLLRQLYRPAGDDQRQYLEATAALSEGVEMRSMARTVDSGGDGGSSTLVELKAVDDLYPLYGRMELAGGGDLETALERRDGIWGAVVEDTVLGRLGLVVGDRVAVGEAVLEVRAVIESEPDRAGGGGFSLGPRLMIAMDALADTALVQPGSMIYHTYRVRLPPGGTPAGYVADLRERFPDAVWRIRDFTNAAPRLEEMIGRLTLFLTLVGLTALVVGGVGVGNAVKAYLDGKVATIATFKCVGAQRRLVFATYMAQIMVLSVVGIVLGLIVGAAAPGLLAGLFGSLLPVSVTVGFYPGALAVAAAFGLLTALLFTLWPLARAGDIPAATLFRSLVAPAPGRPGPAILAATIVVALLLAGLAVVTAADRMLALYFVAGVAAAIAAFRLAAAGVIAASRRMGRPRRPTLRLALANLHRPGAPTASVMLSVGLGLTVLVAIALIQGNMSRQVQESLPSQAPAFFFVDVQAAQAPSFADQVRAIDGVGALRQVPSLRGRIVAVNGVPAEQALVNRDHAWILEGDRGVTFSANQSEDHQVIDGDWWPADYAGPPLVSIYEDIAHAFDIGVGDRLTVNVLGRDIDAEIATLRSIDFGTLNINFTLVFSPAPLNAAPYTVIATVEATEAAEPVVQRAVTQGFPNVTVVRVRDALDTVNDILRKIGTAVRSTALVTLVAGVLVLAGAVAAGHRRRVYDSVVLKVLGATRGDVLRVFLLEYGLLGLVTAALAALIGTAAAWGVVRHVMDLDWVFLPASVVVTAVAATAITVAFGFVGTWRAMGQKAAPLLRNE
ncbi:MAG: ABC transporter permease [Inquilinaceae bacterium]